jgi:hypothetical protein
VIVVNYHRKTHRITTIWIKSYLMKSEIIVHKIVLILMMDEKLKKMNHTQCMRLSLIFIWEPMFPDPPINFN